MERTTALASHEQVGIKWVVSGDQSPAVVCPASEVLSPLAWTCLGKVESSSEGRGAFHGQAAATVREGICGRSTVRLVEVSGRTQREIARDLGVGLSTLRRWLDKRREHEIEAPPPERQEDLAAELKRLRRENEILRQEREILKRAATFFAKEGSR